MRSLVTSIVIAVILGAGVSEARSAEKTSPVIDVPALPPGTVVRPVAFTRLVMKLNRGQPWGVIQGGVFCIPQGNLSWRSGRLDVRSEDFDEVFREELEKVGFKVEGDPNNLFEQTQSSSEYAVAGSIRKVEAKLCFPMMGFGDYSTSKGSAYIETEWQIYSRLKKQVIAKITTRGNFIISKTTDAGFESILYAAFAENVKALIISPEFRETFVGGERDPNIAVRAPSGLSELAMVGAGGSDQRSINDIVSGVVAVFAGDGFGSGVLISRDGYVLTNQHVVGTAKFVKIRWSDGFETLGEVVRVDKPRDVALIKTDGRSRDPVFVRLSPTQPGETVFAIGTPLDAKFQSTVTRGVVSANRVFDGFTFIQSDVAVNPGNSGGPLLDEQGFLLGVTVSGYRIGNAPVDINLFVPVRDAFDFLGLKATP